MSRLCLPPGRVARQPDQSPSARAAEVDEVLANLGDGAADAGLFGTEPAKRRPATPTSPSASRRSNSSCCRTPTRGGTLNHLGVDVDGAAAVRTEQARLAARAWPVPIGKIVSLLSQQGGLSGLYVAARRRGYEGW